MMDLETVYRDMKKVIDGVLDGTLAADAGDTVAKAGYVQVKAAEVDLKHRIAGGRREIGAE